jgi:hypothetical protein
MVKSNSPFSPPALAVGPFQVVLRIRIHVFLGLLDPDPLVRDMDPAPDPDLLSSCKNSKKNLDSYYFVTLFYFLSLKNDVNVH